jgi:hypothetical protein
MPATITRKSAISALKKNRNLCLEWLVEYAISIDPDNDDSRIYLTEKVDEFIAKKFNLKKGGVARLRKRCGIVGNSKDGSAVLIHYGSFCRKICHNSVDTMRNKINDLFDEWCLPAVEEKVAPQEVIPEENPVVEKPKRAKQPKQALLRAVTSKPPALVSVPVTRQIEKPPVLQERQLSESKPVSVPVSFSQEVLAKIFNSDPEVQAAFKELITNANGRHSQRH